VSDKNLVGIGIWPDSGKKFRLERQIRELSACKELAKDMKNKWSKKKRWPKSKLQEIPFKE
jgi:hypothetical protein